MTFLICPHCFNRNRDNHKKVFDHQLTSTSVYTIICNNCSILGYNVKLRQGCDGCGKPVDHYNLLKHYNMVSVKDNKPVVISYCSDCDDKYGD